MAPDAPAAPPSAALPPPLPPPPAGATGSGSAFEPDFVPRPRQPGLLALVALALVAAAAALWMTLQERERINELEATLVQREQAMQTQAAEAALLARQSQEIARDAVAKASLLEARVAEVAMQRGQLEELIQSFSRSRDENVLGDIDAALRVAQRQSLITGSIEPLVAALKQADDRLERAAQPRLEGVRRAIARDLQRVQAAGVPDISALVIKVDEVVRAVDDLPLVATADAARSKEAPAAAAAAEKGKPRAAAASAPASAPEPSAVVAWLQSFGEAWARFGERVWSETRSLVRITPIEHPEAALLVPEQAYFLRANLKLRLLNARLALLSRQFDTAQSDLRASQTTIERYFDRGSRRVTIAIDLLREVASQARQVNLPTPNETFAALTAAAGR
jgi:uroporphyrin-3 C-methyltransferase